MSETPKWYVVHTFSGYENKVAQNLEKTIENRKMREYIPSVKVPVELVEEVSGNKTKVVERKLFPGYVLVKMVMTDETWYIVRNIRGVTGFVGQVPPEKPDPLPESEVIALGIEVEDGEIVTPIKTSIDIKVGDNVKITEGLLEGLDGDVIAVDEENLTVTVEIFMLGRIAPTTLDVKQVKKN